MFDERLSGLIGLIYEASMQPALWPRVLEDLVAVTPAVAAMIGSHDSVARTTVFQQSFGLNPDFMPIYAEKWAASNPVIDAMALIAPGDVSGLAPLIDYAAFRQHPFSREWGTPQGYCDSINIVLERTPTRMASVSLITSEDQGLADAATLGRLRILAPHFLRAIRIGRVLDHATVERHALVATLDALASAVLLLDPTGDIVHANVGALGLVSRGLTVDRLRAGLRGFDGATAASVRTEVEDRTVVVAAESGERFVCHPLPLILGGLSRGSASPLVLVVIRSAISTDRAARIASTLYGLTNRERDVLFGLVEVGGITAVAAMLGVSKATVKTHVRSLFHKTQTHRQSDLVKLIGDVDTPFARRR